MTHCNWIYRSNLPARMHGQVMYKLPLPLSFSLLPSSSTTMVKILRLPSRDNALSVAGIPQLVFSIASYCRQGDDPLTVAVLYRAFLQGLEDAGVLKVHGAPSLYICKDHPKFSRGLNTV